MYRWFNFTFRLGVFVARSSIYFIQIRYLPLFPLFQVINLFVVLGHVLFDFIPQIFILLAIILWEGFLGGGCYANAFNLISSEIPVKYREFSMAITSVADSIGIALAGLIAIPVHNIICEF